jgi:multidrug efflux pump
MVPPYFASGAGAEMRRSVGTAMLWGAFGVTAFGLFLTPVFYFVVRWFTDRKPGEPALAHGAGTAPVGTTPEAAVAPPRGDSDTRETDSRTLVQTTNHLHEAIHV